MCHAPHGSRHAKLVTEKIPNLCQDCHEVKLSFEIYPLDSVDLGFEYTYEINDDDEVILVGRTEDKRHEFYADFM
ncbi:MAG: cytochrome c3 family protein [Proteobacteria bacterium]|nr:cytochrome c3 family protein [Pseudomonadota bacterium]MBU1056938.1 cytochrome c3 family protein [Pseudomonadota bacterium]